MVISQEDYNRAVFITDLIGTIEDYFAEVQAEFPSTTDMEFFDALFVCLASIIAYRYEKLSDSDKEAFLSHTVEKVKADIIEAVKSGNYKTVIWLSGRKR